MISGKYFCAQVLIVAAVLFKACFPTYIIVFESLLRVRFENENESLFCLGFELGDSMSDVEISFYLNLVKGYQIFSLSI